MRVFEGAGRKRTVRRPRDIEPMNLGMKIEGRDIFGSLGVCGWGGEVVVDIVVVVAL